MTINIAKDYSKTPGGRFIKEGEYSGEDFREKILAPAFAKCKKNGEQLTVNLDGGYGYGSSFLEEAFGGLVRKNKDKSILQIKLISDEEPKLICESIGPLEKINSDKVYIRVDDLQMAKFMKSQLVNITSQYKGDSALYVFTANDRKNYRMPRDMWVNLNSEVLFELKKIFGESNVKIVE